MLSICFLKMKNLNTTVWFKVFSYQIPEKTILAMKVNADIKCNLFVNIAEQPGINKIISY